MRRLILTALLLCLLGSEALGQTCPAGSAPAYFWGRTRDSVTGELRDVACIDANGRLTLNAKTVDKVVYASDYNGADAGAKINNAIADTPSTGCRVEINFEGVQAYTTPISITKPCILTGLGQRVTVLNFTPITGNAITVNIPYAGGADGTFVMEDFKLLGPNLGTGNGIVIQSGIHFSLRNLFVQDFGNDGIWVDGTAPGNNDLSEMVNVSSYSNGGNGIRTSGTDSNAIKFIGTDASQNSVGYRIETFSNIFVGAHADDNTTKAASFTSNFNYGTIFAERQGANDIYFEAGSGYNEIYNIAAGPNEAHPFYNLSVASGFALNGAVYRNAVFKDPTGGYTFGGSFVAGIFSTAAPTSGQHVGLSGRAELEASNTQNHTGTLEGVRGTVTTATGATGTISNIINFRTESVLNGGAVTNLIGLKIPAPTGTVTPTNIYAIQADSGAGIAQVADGIQPGSCTFANLGTPANGVMRYCSNCTITNPCAAAGTGAIAKRLNGVWVCN